MDSMAAPSWKKSMAAPALTLRGRNRTADRQAWTCAGPDFFLLQAIQDREMYMIASKVPVVIKL